MVGHEHGSENPVRKNHGFVKSIIFLIFYEVRFHGEIVRPSAFLMRIVFARESYSRTISPTHSYTTDVLFSRLLVVPFSVLILSLVLDTLFCSDTQDTVPEFYVERSLQRLRVKISQHLFSGAIVDINLSLLDPVSDGKVSNVDVPGSLGA